MQIVNKNFNINSTKPASTELVSAISYLTSLQNKSGYVVGEVVWCPMITAQYIITAFITNQEIPQDRKDKLLQYFQSRQTKEGGWGLHPESPPFVFTTTLTYVALRLLGIPPENEICQCARKWLEKQGGILQIPSWGKFLLALLNLYKWEGVNPVLPEMWLLPKWLPIHPRLMYCHTRMIYLAMSYLYGIKFQTPETELIKQLRRELYGDSYEKINFFDYRNTIAATDIYVKPIFLLKMVYRSLIIYDNHHSTTRRQQALNEILDHVIYHQRQMNYAAMNPLNGMFNTLILYHAKHEDFLPSFHGIDYWLWEDEAEGLRYMGATSETWDTAFTIQAICEGPANFQYNASHFLHNANEYIKQSLMQEELPNYQNYYHDAIFGGFCFGDGIRLPVSDCTGEVLSALCHLRKHIPKEKQISTTMILANVNFIFSRQNRDGGWGSYERRRGGFLLELFNPTEMFGDCMVEKSYVECSASCIHGLRQALDYYPELHHTPEFRAIPAVIKRGEKFLRHKQCNDGSWQGFWGINYLYGTLFGVLGLLDSGASHDDPAILRACKWIVSKRLPDGGWGESWQGCRERRYIPHEHSQVIMTSWALILLIKTNYHQEDADTAIETGIALLKERQLSTGDWPREAVAGVFYGTGMLEYCLYKNYFPTWALALYERQHLMTISQPSLEQSLF